MENIFPARRNDIERRSIITGYILRAVNQPDIAVLDPEVVTQFKTEWPDVQATIDEAIRNPSLYSSNYRKNLAAHQSLISLAAANYLQVNPTTQDGQQIFAFDSMNAPATVRRAERLRDPSRTIYSPMARILRSAGVNFDPKSYDTELAAESSVACGQDAENLSGSMRTIQRIWKRSGLVMGSFADTDTGTVSRREVHIFENFQPSSDGKLRRQSQLIADLKRLVLAIN
jgi:hypothetical protein